MKNVFFLIFLFTTVIAKASGQAEGIDSAHSESHIPFEQIGWQAANLGILLLALFFLIKNSVVETFQQREKKFLDQSTKTQNALKEAEKALVDIKARLKDLESNEKATIEKAIKESNQLKDQIVKESEEQSKKIKQDAQLIIQSEVEKAKLEISKSYLNSGISKATNQIAQQSDELSKNSEAEFLRQISQVQI